MGAATLADTRISCLHVCVTHLLWHRATAATKAAASRPQHGGPGGPKTSRRLLLTPPLPQDAQQRYGAS